MQPRSDAAPEKFSQNTIEENMLRVLSLPTKSAAISARAITFADFLTSRQPPARSLPEGNLDLWRDAGSPNPLEFGSVRTRNQLAI